MFIKGSGWYTTYKYLDKNNIEERISYKPGTLLNVPPGLLHSYDSHEEHILVYWKWELEKKHKNITTGKMIFKEVDNAGRANA